MKTRIYNNFTPKFWTPSLRRGRGAPDKSHFIEGAPKNIVHKFDTFTLKCSQWGPGFKFVELHIKVISHVKIVKIYSTRQSDDWFPGI